MKTQPQLLIVPDEDYEYGIKHGAYPEFNEELKTGEVVVISREEAITNFGISSPKENKIYVRNVFDGTYRDITAENTEKVFIEAKAVAIRRTLVMLGAYSAKLEHHIKHAQEKDFTIGAKGKKGNDSIGVNYHQNKHKEVNLDAAINLDPFSRSAKDVGEIRQYIYTHGLGCDSNLIEWIDRLESDGKLVGREGIEISFLEELTTARDAALNLQIVQSEVGFNIESLNKETHSFTVSIAVDWSGPDAQ